MCSPGSTIKAKRSKKVKLSSGPQNNRSKSGYGVINGFDRKCLNILHQMTKAYVKNQYPDSTPSELQSVWIPFIITDLVERHGLAEGEHSSRVVCESLLRICETWFYINTESTVVIDGEIPKAEMHRFGVMKNYKIAGAKELREKVINPQDDDDDDDEIDVVTDSDDNMSIKERINEDHGTNIPFLAVICQWNDTYYKDLNKYDAPIQELDVKINMLPPCLFEFHEYLKMHHESRTAIFSRGYSFQLELFTLIELIYPSESDQKKKDLVKDFIGDCKQMKNKYKVTRSIERRTSTRDTIYIDLFGFVFSITVNNWDKADAQMNLSCLVTCKANASSSHVKELMVESKLNFDSSSKRLARSAIGQEIKSVLGPIKKKKYIVKFTISGNEFSLSKYDSLNTKNSIRDSVISLAKLQNVTLTETNVDLYLTNLTDNLSFFNGVDSKLLDKISEITLIKRNDIVDYLSYRSKRTIALSLMNPSELRDFFQGAL
ncbi:hypothetical protein JCM19233_109 [Vibrio astriarenae]|nr:hypothetical protein JCM19233_109 [Vibrio sp. C7]